MAMDLVLEMERVVRALTAAGIDYALCGGIALAVHGAPRATKDIDLLIRREDEERALTAVEPIGFTERALPMTFNAGTPRESRVLRVSKLDGARFLTLDLLVVTPVLEEVFRGRATYEWRGNPLYAVTREGLVTMKRLAGRHQDLADLERLGVPDAKRD